MSILALAAMLAFTAAAHAEVPALVFYGNTAVEGPGVAVDQSNGDVFTAGIFTYCNESEVCGFEGHLHQLDAEGNIIQTIGSKSLYSGAVVNPVNKDLYVLNASGQIQEYDPSTEEQVAEFAVAPSRNFFGSFTVVQIGVDSSGNVYVPVIPENEVLEYSEAGTLLNTFKGTGSGELDGPVAVAIDSSGNLWAADAGNNRIEELSPADAPLTEIKSEGVSSVALGADGTVYAVVYNSTDFCGTLAFSPPCTHLIEYSSSGAQVADVGAGAIGRAVGFIAAERNSMVAVNESTGEVYVTDIDYDLLWVYGPPAAPRITKELTDNVDPTEAGLGALVDAGGLAATYQFEYGTTTAYGHLAPSAQGHAAGVKPHAVWAEADGLAPGTTYHYRVVMHNALGTVDGEDATFTTPSAKGECPNEAFRTGFSMRLPDCRAYEMVTQPNTAASQPDPNKKGPGADWGTLFAGGGYTRNHAARDGERFAYLTDEVMPEADSSGMEYLATRGSEGWISEDVIPRQSYTQMFCTNPEFGNAIEAWSSDLTRGVIRVGANERQGTSTKAEGTGACGAEGLEVIKGEPGGVENLLLRDSATGAFQLLDMPPAEAIPTDAHFEGASADLGRVFFKENTRLTEDGPPGVEGLYEWNEGTLSLISILPNGTPVGGTLATLWPMRRSVISNDGTRVFFTAEGKLYERIDGERTVQLDKPQGGSGAGGSAEFAAASGDGTHAYFTDEASAGLTSDTVEGSGTNLYGYTAGALTDLTPGALAEVEKVLAVSSDGSHVYFAARADLTGAQENQYGETAKEPPAGHSSQVNLYDWHEGTTTFIATLQSLDENQWGTAQTTASGKYFAFVAADSLTGYDNTDLKTHRADDEIFLFNSASGELSCVSCDPSGESPSAGGTILNRSEWGVYKGAGQLGAPGQGAPHQLFGSGRLIFQTEESLLPSDTNATTDVYEYEEGQLHLISSGTGTDRSWLLDASEEGKDVFFLTRQSLLPQDLGGDESLVIYDAREGGGLPEHASSPTCTTAESCRAAASPQPEIYGAPSSQTFAGEGNLAPVTAGKGKAATKGTPRQAVSRCRRRFAHSKAKRRACARKSQKRHWRHGDRGRRGSRAHKRHRHKSTHKSSGHNRRGK